LCYNILMKKQKIFVIGGPTASGKSSLAIRLASELSGSVVNGDAIQVYKDLSVLSARPSPEEEKIVPHYLFGYIDAWTNPSMADWLQKVKEVVPSLQNPIVVGGTGMYLDALMEGVNQIPDVDPKIRQRVRKMDLAEVASMVKDCPFKDPQRMRRALEVQLSTGKPLIYFQKLPKNKILDADFCLIHVLPQREKVYESCAVRFELMKQQGAIEEVTRLKEMKASGGVLKAIGVPEISAYLDGKISQEEMTQKVVVATRQYAKRQMTWFRHHGQPQFVISDVKNTNIKNITK